MKLLTLLAIGCLTVASGAADASLLWGGRSGAYRIDPATGALSLPPTSVPEYGLNDAASDPLREPGVFWGASGASQAGGGGIVAIDPLSDEVLSVVPFDAPLTIESIAIDPTTGVMFGASPSSLYTIDRTTGAATAVGPTGRDLTRALAFDNGGNLYGIANGNELISVDKNSAATSLIATMDLRRVEDFAARPEDGAMFGLAYTEQSYQLVSIDVATGGVTLVGPSLVRPSYLAFIGVPEPSAAWLFAAAGGGAAGRHRRRRPRDPFAAGQG